MDWYRTTAKPREIRTRLTAVYKKCGPALGAHDLDGYHRLVPRWHSFHLAPQVSRSTNRSAAHYGDRSMLTTERYRMVRT